jgi:hypothetical protein
MMGRHRLLRPLSCGLVKDDKRRLGQIVGRAVFPAYLSGRHQRLKLNVVSAATRDTLVRRQWIALLGEGQQIRDRPGCAPRGPLRERSFRVKPALAIQTPKLHLKSRHLNRRQTRPAFGP